jgi:molecular chaperone IbpA
MLLIGGCGYEEHRFSPLSLSSIGFDRLLERLEEAARAPERDAGYPPHNIKKIGAEGYRFELALAGFHRRSG